MHNLKHLDTSLTKQELTGKMTQEIGPFCTCGCKGHVKWHKNKKCWNRFLQGHNRKGKERSKEVREKIRVANLGRKCSEEKRSKISKALQQFPVKWDLSKAQLAEKMSKQLGPFCACGCGIRVKWGEYTRGWNKFIVGHQSVGKKASATTREKMRKKRFSEESREKCRRANLGKKRSITFREKMKSIQIKRWQDPNYAAKFLTRTHLISAGGYRDDLQHYVRSSWEANFARLLKFLGENYEYEPERFMIRDCEGEVIATYLPDFYLTDSVRYVEVKGWWRSGVREKLQLFRECYSGITLDVVDSKEYMKLKEKFSGLVPNWE